MQACRQAGIVAYVLHKALHMNMQAQVGKRLCPRCKRELSMDLFQPPVRICMVCYGGNPGNEDISMNLAALKDKASRSRFARVQKAHTRSEQRLMAVASQVQAVNTKQRQDDKEPCDVCGKLMLEREIIVMNPPLAIAMDTPTKHVCSTDCAASLGEAWKKEGE